MNGKLTQQAICKVVANAGREALEDAIKPLVGGTSDDSDGYPAIGMEEVIHRAAADITLASADSIAEKIRKLLDQIERLAG